MKLLAVLALVFAATPAFSQPRVYTNADLGRTLSPIPGTSPAEAVAILRALQPAPPAPRSVSTWWVPGPQVHVIPSSPTAGPFGEFAPFSEARRLDGTALDTAPWTSTTYLPWSWGSGPRRAGGVRHDGPHTGSHSIRPRAVNR
jgi:hypothetical protein